ncbi:MAG: WG repeat-containing protein [Candidatus Methanomethylophilaceae archaeon]|nr:WG repeat-containing protein [Candidatus Methanomethylophilaceae archaeon]
MNTTAKRILSITWKVGLGLAGLAAAVFVFLLICVWYEKSHGRNFSRDLTLSKDIVVRGFNDNTVRVWDKAACKYTTGKLRWVAGPPRRDSLTVFCSKEGRRGFLNVRTGRIVIPAQYRKAWQFSEGLGAVVWDEHVGFIDRKNRPVIEYVIPFEKGFDYIFRDGYCTVKYWDVDKYRYAVFRKDGRMVLGWDYRFIDEPDGNGYRVAANDDGYWLFDKDFRPVFPEPVDYMELARGYSGVYVTKGHVKQLLDFDGTVLEPFIIDDTYRLKYKTKIHSEDPDEYELDPDVVVYRVGRWEGLMDARTGKVITPAEYWGFEMVSKDLIRAQFGHNDEGVVMDKRGKIVKQ